MWIDSHSRFRRLANYEQRVRLQWVLSSTSSPTIVVIIISYVPACTCVCVCLCGVCTCAYRRQASHLSKPQLLSLWPSVLAKRCQRAQLTLPRSDWKTRTLTVADLESLVSLISDLSKKWYCKYVEFNTRHGVHLIRKDKWTGLCGQLDWIFRIDLCKKSGVHMQ